MLDALGFDLLSSPSDASPARRHDTSPRASRDPRKPVVYLAEDDHALRSLLCEGLRDNGFDVQSAGSGDEMLHLLTDASRRLLPAPDAIVMDVRMPYCDGIDVLAALRLAEWTQPVVMMTGFGDVEVHDRAAGYGASVILDKPFDTEELVGMLDVLLRLAHSDALPALDTSASDQDVAPPTSRSPGTLDMADASSGNETRALT